MEISCPSINAILDLYNSHMFTGGLSSKRGERYEEWWAAWQLLRLVKGRVRSVRWESLGTEETGLDLTLGSETGELEGQQCKINNSRAPWTIAQLASRDVLGYMERFLKEGPTHRYTFISNMQASDMKRLTELARMSGSWLAFDSRLTTDTESSTAWKALIKQSNRSDANDEVLYELLTRAYFAVHDEGHTGRTLVLELADEIVAADPQTTVTRLIDFAHDHLTREIYPETVRSFLKSSSLPLRNYAGTARLLTCTQTVQEEYISSVRDPLIGGTLLPRDEVPRLLEKVMATHGPRIHCVHGRAGLGKSSVLYGLICQLTEKDIPFLPLRFDTHPPRDNPRLYGERVGLPGSPVRCLADWAVGRRCVLILDQLDALRWTPQHEPSAVPVFRRLINEVMQSGDNMHVVVACRTFDLRHDTHISLWRQAPELKDAVSELEVGELSEAVTEKVVTAGGVDWSQLTHSQRRLLRQPNLISLWLQVRVTAPARLTFRTASDLLSAFWETKSLQLTQAGVTAADLKSTVQKLVTWLDKHGRLSAPPSILNGFSVVAKALRSAGVLDHNTADLRFVHQSYFDYQLAVMAQSQLRQKGGLQAWLKTNDEQSLLRRGQLRFLLSLIRDEEPDNYLAALEHLILDETVRFHLRHLALQFLGDLPEPIAAEFDFVMSLIAKPGWRDVAASQVLFGRAAWAKLLIERGRMEEWLGSSEPAHVNLGAYVARSVVEHEDCADALASLLIRLAHAAPERRNMIAGILPWSLDKESADMFELRLILIEAGCFRDGHLHYSKQLASSHPDRMIRLFSLELSRQPKERSVPDDWQAKHSDWPWWVPHHIAENLEVAVKERPLKFWQESLPVFLKRAAHPEPLRWNDQQCYTPDALWHESVTSHRLGGNVPLPRLLAKAGTEAISSGELQLDSILNCLGGSEARIVQQANLTLLLELPVEYADQVVDWLIGDWRRFSLGKIERDGRWRLAHAAITRFAPHCSPGRFSSLERMILSLSPEWEWESAKFMIQHYSGTKYQYHSNPVGLLQHALLPALPEGRMASSTKERQRQLQQKFGAPASKIDADHEPKGGFVSSPIRGRAGRLSDGAWIRLLSGPLKRSDPHGWVIKGGRPVEASPEMFATDLREQAKADPTRFGRLALRLPGGISSCYWPAILDGMQQTQPGQEHHIGWRPAPADLCNSVIEKLGYRSDRSVAKAVCWTISARSDVPWSSEVIRVLLEYAVSHSDPEADEEWYVHDDTRIDHQALNSVRGSAARAMARLLYDVPGLFPQFQSAIEQLCVDPAPGVRGAAVGLLTPVLNIDRDWAVERFLNIDPGPQGEVYLSNSVDHFLCNTLWSHHARFVELFERAASSSDPGVAKFGISWITVTWLYFDTMEVQFKRFANGTTEQRASVAEVLARQLGREKVTAKCAEWLPMFFNDPDKAVRTSSTHFSYTRDFDPITHRDTLIKFIQSPAFFSERSRLVMALEEHRGSLEPLKDVLFAMSDRTAVGPTEADDIDATDAWYDLGKVAELLLKLYGDVERSPEQAAIRTGCLNRWDNQLRKKPQAYHSILQALES
jgi:hypothetical protein